MACIHHLGGASLRQKATGVHDLDANNAHLLVGVDSSGVVTVAPSAAAPHVHTPVSAAPPAAPSRWPAGARTATSVAAGPGASTGELP